MEVDITEFKVYIFLLLIVKQLVFYNVQTTNLTFIDKI